MFENKLLFKLSFLLYELIFVNVRANIYGIRMIITIIIRFTLWQHVDHRGKPVLSQPFMGEVCAKVVTKDVCISL